MTTDHIATQTITVRASLGEVWDALVNPRIIKEYMFGTNAVSDWKEGSAIIWKGEWQGRPYEDKGVILRLEPERMLRYTHFSPSPGLPDDPENYHIVTVTLSPRSEGVEVSLTQDNNPDDQARELSERNWGMMLTGLKGFVERISK